MKLICNNVIPSATMTSTGTLRGYGVSMLQDRAVATKFKLVATSGTVFIDCGAPAAVSGVALFGHSLLATAVVTLQGSSTELGFAPPEFSQAIPIASAGVDVAVYFQEQSLRYWRLVIQDSLNPLVEIGAMVLGKAFDVPSVMPDVALPVESVDNSFLSRSGQVYGHKVYQARHPAFKLFGVTDVQRKALSSAWAFHGTVEPLALSVWEDSHDVYPPIYGVFSMQTLQWDKHPHEGLLYATSFSVREVF